MSSRTSNRVLTSAKRANLTFIHTRYVNNSAASLRVDCLCAVRVKKGAALRFHMLTGLITSHGAISNSIVCVRSFTPLSLHHIESRGSALTTRSRYDETALYKRSNLVQKF